MAGSGTQGPNAGLFWGWLDGEAGWGLGGFNPNAALLDAVLMAEVTSVVMSDPPAAATEGARYIVAAGGTGAWAGHDNALAVYRGGAWAFYAPKRGWRVYNSAADKFLWFDGATWAVEPGGAAGGGGTSWAIPFRGAKVRVGANIVSPAAGAISFNTADRDTDGFYASGAPTRLTVPAGVTKVRLRGFVQFAAFDVSAMGYGLSISKNGTTIADGGGCNAANTYNNPAGSAVSAVLNVAAGDYFELRWFSTDTTVTISAGTWFEIEVVESTAAPFAVVDAPPDGKLYYRKDAAWTLGQQDISLFLPGVPSGTSALLARYVFPRAVTLPAGLVGSQGYAGAAATGATTLVLRKNGVDIGTVNFAAGAQVATFTLAAAVSFAAGDRLAVYSPSSLDATLADVSLTFVGNRS